MQTKIAVAKLRAPKIDVRLGRKEKTLARYEADIHERGVQNPLHVHALSDGTYEIINGYTRYLAGVRAGLQEFPCIVHSEPMDEGDLMTARVLDQDLNEPLNKIEFAQACLTMMRLKGWDQAQLARAWKMREEQISKPLRVFEELAEDLHPIVASGELRFSLAYELKKVPHEKQREWAKLILKGLLTREALQERIRRLGPRPPKPKPTKVVTSKGVTILVPHGLDYEAAMDELDEAKRRFRKGKRNDEAENPPVHLPGTAANPN